jgi:Flp pilus assembly protein TadG
MLWSRRQQWTKWPLNCRVGSTDATSMGASPDRSAGKSRRRRRDRGAALVEFALVFPLLALLIFGLIDFGYAINRDTMINNAARDGAREGSVNPNQTAIQSKVMSELSDLPASSVTVTVSCRKPDDTACSNFSTDAKPGGTVIVTVQYTHRWLTFVPGLVGQGSTISLRKTTEMRIE